MTQQLLLRTPGSLAFGIEQCQMIFCKKLVGKLKKQKARLLNKFLPNITIYDRHILFFFELSLRKNTIRLLKTWQLDRDAFPEMGTNLILVTLNMPCTDSQNSEKETMLRSLKNN